MADLNNVGPRGGGAITAGLFLKEFAGDPPWAHLDIAGPAFHREGHAAGAQGRHRLRGAHDPHATSRTADERVTGRVDLHSHTTASDGALSPRELVRLAARHG